MKSYVRAVVLIILVFVFGILAILYSRVLPRSTIIPDILSNVSVTPLGWPMLTQPTFSPMTLATIFSADHAWVQSLPKEKTITMIATGDVIPARSVNYKMVTGKGFLWPFEKTKDILSAADLTIINLETPLIADCRPTVDGMIFCGSDKAVEGLISAGVDIATLGNNHAGNYDVEGVEETKKVLTQAGVTPVAIGPAYKEIKGTRFAFLSYNDIGIPEEGIPWADEGKIKVDIATAKKSADIVIVSYHWGVEYVTKPSARQRTLAHMTVDAGADVVLGNHPHWIQPVELYNGKFIIYAHGNFVFDQEWSAETKLGVVGRYTFYDNKLVDVEYLPIRIVEYGQPYFLEGAAASNVMRQMQEASIALSSR